MIVAVMVAAYAVLDGFDLAQAPLPGRGPHQR